MLYGKLCCNGWRCCYSEFLFIIRTGELSTPHDWTLFENWRYGWSRLSDNSFLLFFFLRYRPTRHLSSRISDLCYCCNIFHVTTYGFGMGPVLLCRGWYICTLYNAHMLCVHVLYFRLLLYLLPPTVLVIYHHPLPINVIKGIIEVEGMKTLQRHNRELLRNILPDHVATHFLERSKDDEVRYIMLLCVSFATMSWLQGLYSCSHDCVGVIFASIPNFTAGGNLTKDESKSLKLLNEIIFDVDEVGVCILVTGC